jgi:outer membrane protein OmpA-like peptidoglycan-associated protein
MGLLDGFSKPATEGPPSKPGSSAGWKSLVWALIGLASVAALALLFWHRLARLELQVSQLSQQVEQANQRLGKVEERSDAALGQASQAAANAQRAAQQRDLAQTAEAKSAQEAELARQQAQAAQNEAALARQKAEQFRRQREEELTRLQEVLGQIAETRRTAMGLIMTLGSNSIRFDFDRAALRPENREVLSRIAGVLTPLKGYTIYVYGYTDDIGTREYNQKLSERRAGAVRDYLVQAGLNPSIITAKGYGKSDPRVPGNTPKARAINRRVEIGIVDSRIQLQEPPPPGT